MTSGQDRRRGQQQSQRIQIPENVAEFYANTMNIAFTAWDFTLFFGSITLPESLAVGETGTVRGQIKIDAVIRMSPQHAKASLRALKNTVEHWEQQFGEIRIPEEEVRGENPESSR